MAEPPSEAAAPASPSAGYSGTPLPQKLGLKDGQVVLFLGLPENLEGLASAADFSVAERLPDWREVDPKKDRRDLVLAFFEKADELRAALPVLRAALRPDGAIWVSWPKKASRRMTDISEDVIREIALPTGLVDVKVAAIDEVWSGLKLMIRKELR